MLLVNTLVSLCVTDSQQQQLLFVWNEHKMNSVASQQQHLTAQFTSKLKERKRIDMRNKYNRKKGSGTISDMTCEQKQHSRRYLIPTVLP